MLNFLNDYEYGCIPEIIDLMEKVNNQTFSPFGKDPYTKWAREIVQSKMPNTKVDIHFVYGGTLANLVMVRSALKSYESIIAVDTAHVTRGEAGAVEATGHKIVVIKSVDAKLTKKTIREAYLAQMTQPGHMTYPKAVFMSNATEYGTAYTRKEIEDIRAVCDEFGMYLIMDGIRLGSALMSNGVDYTLDDIARWCDMFVLGGTKYGALFGEAVCISNPELQTNFRFAMKQSGAIFEKGWLLGIQFVGLFKDDAFYKVAQHELEMAEQLQKLLVELKYPLYIKSTTNQIFIYVTPEEREYLKKYVLFEDWEMNDYYIAIRFVTSWRTTLEEIQQLTVILKQAKQYKKN